MMIRTRGSQAEFRRAFPRSDEVYLLMRGPRGERQWVAMRPSRDPEHWETTVELAPGRYRYRYYRKINDAVIYYPPCPTHHPLRDGWDAEVEVAESAL